MERLKADFHTHTGDDPRDPIRYSAETLFDAMAGLGFDVVAITCHDKVVYTERHVRAAEERGLLLIPGIERDVEGRHVLMLNPDAEQAEAETFDELRRLGRREAVFVAPHPFFPIAAALRDKLAEHIDLFDAIEHTSLYYGCINFNTKAVAAAREYGLPLVGNSDVHRLPYEANNFTWVEAERTVSSVLEAVRAGRVELDTRPIPARRLPREAVEAAGSFVRDILRKLE